SGARLVLVTQRRRLDARLAEQAAAAGARFADEMRVDDVAADNGHVTARVGATRVRGSVVVGADGGTGTDIVGGVALEGNVDWRHLDERRYRGRALFDVGVVPGGYGWIFPKRGH